MKKLFLVFNSEVSPGTMTVSKVGNTITFVNTTVIPGILPVATGELTAISIPNVVKIEGIYIVKKGGGTAGGGQGGSAETIGATPGPFTNSQIVTLKLNGGETFSFDTKQITNQATWLAAGWVGVNNAIAALAAML